jgi:hypothetical protein
MVKTIVTWNPSSIINVDDMLRQITEKIFDMERRELLVGQQRITTENMLIVERHWINIAAGEEWINFISALNPSSVEIISDDQS